MKQVTGDINQLTGAHNGGICKVSIAPREWFTASFEINYLTGKVTAIPAFIFGKNWLTLNLINETFDFQEKPKQSPKGEFFETSITGQMNYLDPALRQILNTLRNHEFIVMITDRKKQIRIVGNTDKACAFSFNNRNDNNKAGTEEVSIALNLQTADPAPFL